MKHTLYELYTTYQKLSLQEQIIIADLLGKAIKFQEHRISEEKGKRK